ncbi:uncharacterized protein B0I36DRAFT_338481 [Microdochium trichocladiopsis]|uniref:Uncharacterized protein n=1 Tax=Microdochium trichocladiopsis TaxID=1682393 RepID=A0A9P8XUX5_9PEZI|nr:uncharacterized protein B0I36DRAFT_338481 [Microdochium trichocladiopsis]KAH7014262.1 hypothetical protein B0I36DRAFT_338481 [Microdochium trichocladiopsis]
MVAGRNGYSASSLSSSTTTGYPPASADAEQNGSRIQSDGGEQTQHDGHATLGPQMNLTTKGSGGRLSPDGVRAAAQRAVGRIKTALRQRLDSIRGTRCSDELIWAALEADVFGSSRWFEGPLASDLVAAGFALVEEDPDDAVGAGAAPRRSGHAVGGDAVYGEKSREDGQPDAGGVDNAAGEMRLQNSRKANAPLRARLAEPLVVETIMEYLYESPVEVLDEYLNRFFTPLQTANADRECLWKIAEDVLAKKLQNTVRFTNDTISQHRRTSFFDILRTSRSPTPIHKLRHRSYGMQGLLNGQPQQQPQPLTHHDFWSYGEAERFVGSLDRYYLQDSGTNIDRPGEWRVEDWLYETEEEHRPNFFFFDGGEGYGDDGQEDDGALGCLFFLTDRENVRRKILCVLQFAPAPTTEVTTDQHPGTNDASTPSAHQPNPFPTLTNLITRLWQSYPGSQNQTPWPVFYIYVPPHSVEIDDDAFVAELSRTVKDKMPRNHYVGYVDISNSDGVWGTTFPAWIGQMAEEKRRQVQRLRRERRRELVGRFGR